jgi:glucose/arabinose dehydrogenase
VTPRHRQPPSPAQARVRVLVIGLVVVFAIGALFLRGLGEGSGPGDTTPPVAGETSTTRGSEDGDTDGPDTTTGDGTPSTSFESSDPNLPPLQGLELETLFTGFSQPSTINAIEGDDRLFIAQRVGVIRILDENRELLDPAFLDISDLVLAGGIEQGLLGFDFHPDYDTNGLFYVYYTDKGGRRQLSEFAVSVSDPNRARADSERVLIELEQPPDATDIRHYAGQVGFGPDGYLWVSLGDGADSRRQGQDSNTMFGSVIRIDVDNGEPYEVPADNPFVAGGGADEVWAYGLRNPWRFSIDEATRMIYIADVGHADQEEVNVVPIDDGGGYNFGWSDVEGTRCFHAQPCDLELYTSPAITYLHDEGCSVTGGYVYRGSEIPELDGTYFYSDWCSQWIRSFKFESGTITDETDWTEELGTIGQINSFGVGGDGELYLVTHDGTVAKLTARR